MTNILVIVEPKKPKNGWKRRKSWFCGQVSGSSGSSDYCEAEPAVTPLHAQQRLCMVGREIREVSISQFLISDEKCGRLKSKYSLKYMQLILGPMLHYFSNYSNIRRLEIVPTVKICFKTHDIWIATFRFGDTTYTRRCWQFASWWPNTLLSQWTLNSQVFVFFNEFVFVFAMVNFPSYKSCPFLETLILTRLRLWWFKSYSWVVI